MTLMNGDGALEPQLNGAAHRPVQQQQQQQSQQQPSQGGQQQRHQISSGRSEEPRIVSKVPDELHPRRSSRFGGLAGAVEASVASSMEERQFFNHLMAPFPVSAKDLSDLSNADRNQMPEHLANVLEIGMRNIQKEREGKHHSASTSNGKKDLDKLDVDAAAALEDVEAPPIHESELMAAKPHMKEKLSQDVFKLVEHIRADISNTAHTEEASIESAKNIDMAANVLTAVLLRSSPEHGIDPREVDYRKQVFGSNAIADKELDSFLKLCFEAVQDFVLMMLIVLGTISIVVEVTTHEGKCTTCWIEGAAILVSVCIVVMVTAGIDYAKQFAFIRLTRSLHDTNTKSVIRDGKQISVIDDDVVVGDILSVNSHSLASIPADCVLLGPPADLKMNESSITGESELIKKKPGDIILSGTSAAEGSGRMVVIAVGINSVAGRISARVYESEDAEGELEGEDENSPLFVKLDGIAKNIGVGGTVAASIAFIASCIIGLGFDDAPPRDIIDYLVTAITVLAVAVPEGLPLAVTLSLAFSSSKMMSEMNLVKHLDACETMGCATTICTDKTGTLTANKMSARALFAGTTNYLVDDPKVTLGDYILSHPIGSTATALMDFVCRTIAIDTMNETVLQYGENGEVESSAGNPTEVAMLYLVHDLGQSYMDIRDLTKGRSDQGKLGEYLALGKQYGFSSARKMMSWAVPLEDGTYRVYSKGASEVMLARCTWFLNDGGEPVQLTDDSNALLKETSLAYARRGMRCLALTYRDVPPGFSLDTLSTTVKNSDGSDAYEAETDMTIVGLVGIEDPLRPEVPGAIERCYRAGIDVRLVTGDNPNTAVSIAYQAGILRDFHFKDATTERVSENLKPNVLMIGKDFRSKVYHVIDGKKEFSQEEFDKIWPYLRVLARSSPDDKLTLAHGLNQSNLFADKALCKRLEVEHGITVFPDRQVVAMTGDGTNDAPALKRADIGFAMGIAGTQIAKDAADIILMDDNFASIVTAAKWGRNVYASIQKFLQFQLTVNISAVVSALVGALTYQVSPLAAIQLLWVNLLMDSLASLALASEPPVEELLEKPPVNRTDSMITKHMMANMIGQATYQIAVVMVLLFAGPELFDLPRGDVAYNNDENSVHYTLIFNTFVWMQLFNEVNCRKLKGEFNVFKGVLDNRLFCGILLTTAIMQVLIVQFGSIAFRVNKGGLPAEYWGISMALGAGSLPVQQAINVIYRMGQHLSGYRNKKRKAKDQRLTTQRTNMRHDHEE